MEEKHTSHAKRVYRALKNKKFIFGLFALVIAYILNYQASLFLMDNYGQNLPILNDILLDNLPHLDVAFLYDFLMIIGIGAFIISAVKYDPEKGPYFLIIFAISQITRALFIVLTPFGSPNGTEIGIFSTVDNLFGMFPSGHTINAFLAFALAKGVYRKINLIVLIAVPISLLLARGHYSVDIFSGLIFGYAIYSFGEKYIKHRMQVNIKP